MPGIHFRHRTAARHHDDSDADDGIDNAYYVGNDVAKLRRRQRRIGWGSITSLSQFQCRRILVFVAIIMTLAISISIHAGGNNFWSSMKKSFISYADYDDRVEDETLEFDDGCTFRSYPASRLYGLSSQQQQQQPDFLVSASYIRGEWPIILNPMEHDDDQRQTPPSKVCINTSSWEQQTTNRNGTETETATTNTHSRLPFTDGQNPSIVSLASEPYTYSPFASTTSLPTWPRLDHRHLRPLFALLSDPKADSSFKATTTRTTQISIDELFLGAIAFGSGQCGFGLVEEDNDTKSKEVKDEGPPGGKRAVIYVLAPSTNYVNSTQHTGIGNRRVERKEEKQILSSSSPFFRTLAQSTLLLERDAKYGTSRNRAISPLRLEEESSSVHYARIQLEFDDPRLFFHHGRVWILYRNGPLFGYDAQVHNPVHFEQPRIIDNDVGNEDGKFFTAYVKASETIIIRGGRNIALISEEPIMGKRDGKVLWMPFPKLKALTWIDPVTVVDNIDLRGMDKRLSLMGVEEENDEQGVDGDVQSDGRRNVGAEGRNGRRALRSERQQRTATAKKSNIHGTNGYMIPLASTGELLGIAHFHRPEDRRPSQYALHGHHYTHAFFTIAHDDVGTTTMTTTSSTGGDNNSTTTKAVQRRYKLKRLSNEFVFRTNSIPEGMTQPPTDDGDIIQFASGLDVLGGDIHGRAIISYGINDCEGAVFTLSMQIVQQMLIEVKPGQEVVDLMETIIN